MPRAKTRYGRQDPTRSVYLNRKRDKSMGKEAIDVYQRTRRKAQPWQVKIMEAMLSIDRDGIYIHSIFGYSVPRRNGKNEVVTIRELYGLSVGERILHTAHRTTTSTSAFERLYDLICAAGYVEGEHFSCQRQKGLERIFFFRDSGRDGVINFRTRSSKGGLGEGYDLLIIDEAQEYTDDQETALKYVVSDSRNPQTLMLGTPPTAVSAGTVFLKLRNETLQGMRKNTGWAEWSVEQMSDPHNVDLWYECNPAMGYQLNERKVEQEITGDDIDFNIQRLGLWLEYNQHSAITEEEWDALQVDALPQLTGKLYCGIKFGHDGTNLSASIAVATVDGKIFVESIDCRNIRAGTGWIVDFIMRGEFGQIVIDGANGQQMLFDELCRQRIKPKPILPTVKEVINAGAIFEQMLQSGKLCHRGQPSLRAVVTNCDKRPIGTNGGFGYKSIREDTDISLLDSVILAIWACKQSDNARRPAQIR